MRKNADARLRLGRILAAVFALAMILGAGPGILLVNQPATWFGLPRLYVWGMFWCAVEIVVVTAAYLFVWQTSDEASK